MNSADGSSRSLPRPSRPLSVTLLVFGVLTFAGLHLLRFIVTVRQWTFWGEVLSINPLYLAASGLIWMGVGIVVAWGLFSGRRWARRTTGIAALAYSLYFWLDRLFVAASGIGRNWPFILAANIVLLVVVYWILTNRKSKAFFGAMHD